MIGLSRVPVSTGIKLNEIKPLEETATTRRHLLHPVCVQIYSVFTYTDDKINLEQITPLFL